MPKGSYATSGKVQTWLHRTDTIREIASNSDKIPGTIVDLLSIEKATLEALSVALSDSSFTRREGIHSHAFVRHTEGEKERE